MLGDPHGLPAKLLLPPPPHDLTALHELKLRGTMGAMGQLYPTIVAFSFLAAFVSYYQNYYGLLSPCGITPNPDPETPMVFAPFLPAIPSPLLAFFGVTLSSVACTCAWARPFAFPVLLLLYRHLLNEANGANPNAPFYSFQWDSLLLEAGAIASVQEVITFLLGGRRNVSDHLPRIVLFKLMFMSGVVKIQSACPTWLEMTALEYHYATQPLPTKAAWFALNRFSPSLHRLSVAATLLIEICAPVLLFFPTREVRRLASKIQIFLQILIATTGSYTFFNLLTAGLACGVYDSVDWGGAALNGKGKGKGKEEGEEETRSSKVLPAIQVFLSHCFLAFCAGKMFSIGSLTKEAAKIDFGAVDSSIFQSVGLNLLTGPKEINSTTNLWIPKITFAAFTYLTVVGCKDAAVAFVKNGPARRPAGSLFRLLMHALALVVTVYVGCGLMLPIYGLTQNLQADFIQKPADVFSKIGMHSYSNAVGISGLSNGYGLFRSMTGVDWAENKAGANQPDKFGWAGKPPSVVARPEIILEGMFGDEQWRELNFRWKPGKLDKAPEFVAPFQPRLDWQMWFAALGSYQQNPWLISLMNKLLDNCESVVGLLDEGGSSNLKGMKMIRAVKYDYDFTRVRNSWNAKIPSVVMIEEGGGDAESGSADEFSR